MNKKQRPQKHAVASSKKLILQGVYFSSTADEKLTPHPMRILTSHRCHNRMEYPKKQKTMPHLLTPRSLPHVATFSLLETGIRRKKR